MRTENRKDFTVNWLDHVEPATAGKRVVCWDIREPGLGVRITDKGVVSFFIMKRITDNPDPRRITLGRYPVLGLAEARRMAREKLSVIEQGKDPREEDARQRAAEAAAKAAQQASKFRVWAEKFKAEHLRRLRSADVLWRDIETDFLPHWGDMPIGDIRRSDIKARLNAVEVNSGPYARNRRLAVLRKLFNFVLDDDKPPIEANPATRIKGLPETRRQVILTDKELAEVWNAAATLTPVRAAIIRLLILTGQRLNEIAGMTWGELDMSTGLLTIPAQRMKAKLAHEVPLPPQALAIIGNVGRIAGAPVVFPNKSGRDAASVSTYVKDALDAAIAEARQKAGIAEPMKPWRLHDVRRSVRSGLSALKIVHEVAERVIAHIPGNAVSKAYNVWDYREEKREALAKWAEHIDRITNPQPNVIELRERAGRMPA